ncbi:hypothetical protein, partial [Corynebacterium sp. p3-SID1194]|uniref:hypothetical protein n=1 Tax=Corynebacterium sp. p3-SID1194 TaxID=2916105 RepID=UPI0021A4CA4E
YCQGGCEQLTEEVLFMTEFDVPRLIPSGMAAVSAARRVAMIQVAGRDHWDKTRVPRAGVTAEDVLGLPVTVLDAGAVLDDETAASWKAGSFVFTPSVPARWGLDHTAAQKAQMVEIYRALPHGAKRAWIARQGLYSAKIFRWGQRLGYPTHAQQVSDRVTLDLSGPLTPELITYVVRRYAELPFGEKRAFLAECGLEHVNMMRWISRVADGSISHYVHRRKGCNVDNTTPDDLVGTRELVAKILAENERLKKELDKANRKIDRQDKEIDKWEKTSDVLGKALASMPDLPGVDYDAEENPYPKTKSAAMKLADKKNNTS